LERSLAIPLVGIAGKTEALSLSPILPAGLDGQAGTFSQGAGKQL
jgi:hypothetical protein